MSGVYVDSSALVKLVVHEGESDAVRRYLRRRRPWVSSTLARTEVLRSVTGLGDPAVAAARQVLARCDLVRLNDRLLDRAELLEPAEVPSLDAIHLATADLVRADLGALVTYDERMAEAARAMGFRVAAPA
jgi:predicted nucleic acid-binding protein